MMHGRNPSIYLFGENYSIQAFYIKLGIISNMFELDWFDSGILATNILMFDVHIFIFNV